MLVEVDQDRVRFEMNFAYSNLTMIVKFTPKVRLLSINQPVERRVAHASLRSQTDTVIPTSARHMADNEIWKGVMKQQAHNSRRTQADIVSNMYHGLAFPT